MPLPPDTGTTPSRPTSTYLHGQLQESPCMHVREKIAGPDWTGKVRKLHRALYRLKQAGCVWKHRIHNSLLQLGYHRLRSDACINVWNKERGSGTTWPFIQQSPLCLAVAGQD